MMPEQEVGFWAALDDFLQPIAAFFFIAGALVFLLTGCAARKQATPAGPAPTFAIMVPRQCMEAIEFTDHSYCKGKTLKEMQCYRLALTKKKFCEQLEVNPE